MEFPWAHCELTTEDHVTRTSAVRYKGTRQLHLSARNLKRHLLDRPGSYETRALRHCMKSDRPQRRLCPHKMPRVIVPSLSSRSAARSRSAHSLMPKSRYRAGHSTTENTCPYTASEQVATTFLKDRSQNAGLLMKPERLRGLDTSSKTGSSNRTVISPKKKGMRRREEPNVSIDFARLINRADDEQVLFWFFPNEMLYLYIDDFLRFMAVNSICRISIAASPSRHNYYM